VERDVCSGIGARLCPCHPACPERSRRDQSDPAPSFGRQGAAPGHAVEGSLRLFRGSDLQFTLSFEGLRHTTAPTQKLPKLFLAPLSAFCLPAARGRRSALQPLLWPTFRSVLGLLLPLVGLLLGLWDQAKRTKSKSQGQNPSPGHPTFRCFAPGPLAQTRFSRLRLPQLSQPL